MAKYNSYTGVRKLKQYLEDQRSDGKISGPSLKETDGSYDGEYGPVTAGAYQDWSNGWASTVEGSMAIGTYGGTITPLEWLGTQGQGVLTGAEIAQVKIAIIEYTKGGVDTSSKPPADIVPQTDYTPPPAVAGTKWGTTHWVVAGVVAGVAGLLAWNWYKNRKPSRAGRREAFAPVRGLSCGCGK